MIAQYIQLGDRGWNVLVYYGVNKEDFIEVEDALKQLGCSHSDIRRSLKVLSNSDYKMSIVCVGPSSDVS